MGFHAGASPAPHPHPRPRVPATAGRTRPLDAPTWHHRGGNPTWTARDLTPTPHPPSIQQKGIIKLRNILEKENEENFSPEEYINLYTCVPRRRLPSPEAPRFRRTRSNRARRVRSPPRGSVTLSFLRAATQA